MVLGQGRGAGPTASYGAGQDAAGVRGEGLEICGHVGEATRDVCLQYNVASHDVTRHKWSGPNNGECCCVDDGDVGERHPIGTALDGGHTACIALGGAASVVSHLTEEVEGGGGEARDCSLKVGSTVYHCGLRCSNRRSSAHCSHVGYKGLLLHWAGQVEAIFQVKEVCAFRNNHWRLHSNWNCVCAC